MATPAPTLSRLRQTLARIDPSLAPRLAEDRRCLALDAPIDHVLGGGLASGVLHELAPAAPMDLAAAAGFAIALAARTDGTVLCIATDFAAGEAGALYAPGLALFGLAPEHILMLRVPRVGDVLWAMEEALRCPALACVIAELPGDGKAADLTATQRLSLAAREGTSFGLLLRHRASAVPSAAATRWQIAASLSRPDVFGGLGTTRFDLTLCKNRRGPSGRWIVDWDHHERAFHAAVSIGVAETAFDRSDRAPLVRTA
jgi:protein ImuA